MSQPPVDQRKASCIRKEKYKQILEKGSRIAEESDAHTVIDNLQKVTDLIKASNELISEGKTSDRIGHTSEVVLDAQVIISDQKHLPNDQSDCVNWSDFLLFVAVSENEPWFTDQHGTKNWKLSILRRCICSCPGKPICAFIACIRSFFLSWNQSV